LLSRNTDIRGAGPKHELCDVRLIERIGIRQYAARVDFREEVLNVALAELLEHRGMLSVPETIRLSLIASGVDARGAWVDLKKAILEELAVINPATFAQLRAGKADCCL